MVHKMATVLIVDDDEGVCDFLAEQLAAEGYACKVASNAEEAVAKLNISSFDIVLLDIKLPGMSGIDLLKKSKKCYQKTTVIMISAVNNIDTAVEAMQLGASDYIVKPFTFDKLKATIGRALQYRKEHYAVDSCGRNASHSERTNERWFREIDAIAYGVEAQVDYLDYHSRIVIEKTAELARQLGLPGKEIEKWVITQERLYSERDIQMKSISKKLEQSPMAQVMLGLSPSVESPSIDNAQN